MSIPCWEKYFQLDEKERGNIIPLDFGLRVSIEAGTTLGWERLTGENGLNIGLNQFGKSAPNKDLAEEYGFVPEKLESQIRDCMSHQKVVIE